MSEEPKEEKEHPFYTKMMGIITKGKKNGYGRRQVIYLMDHFRAHPEALKRAHDITIEEAEELSKKALDKKLYG